MTHFKKHTYNMSVRALKRPATRWQKCNTLYFFNWLEKTDLRLDDNVFTMLDVTDTVQIAFAIFVK